MGDAQSRAALKAVRLVIAGGDVMPAGAAREWAAEPGPARLLNGYGPTETVVTATAFEVPAGWDGARVPVGRPLAGRRLYVVDGGGRLLPPGAPGELCIGGGLLARGYLGRPAATAERFVPDPFAAVPGARMYRTGDRARWRADGALDFLGRADEQVKVRGFRIEPGEVEAALGRHPDVAACAVVARDDAPGGRGLVAYVVGGADGEALRAHLRHSLPAHLVPAAFVALDALPLTPNGKLDRRALPVPRVRPAEARHTAPRTPAEALLAGLWAEVLGLERVGVDDDFFALGGHSLLATRLVSRIRQAFGVELPLRALFDAPTVSDLAARVEALRGAGLPALPPVVRMERDGPLPLSFAQERLWFLHRLEPESPFYNIPAALRLQGALDAEVLERALGEIVRRHEALRTVLPERGGVPVQEVAPFGDSRSPWRTCPRWRTWSATRRWPGARRTRRRGRSTWRPGPSFARGCCGWRTTTTRCCCACTTW